MYCPACSNQLTTVSIADVELNICKGACGGI